MIKNLVIISDLHCGCQFGLCPPNPSLDGGGNYIPSKAQMEIWSKWQFFWNDFVPKATKHQDYVIIINGDVIDGTHHNSTTQISHNITDQIKIAYQVIKPLLSKPKCKGLYLIRGTEAHVGKSGQDEEMLAKDLCAIPDELGNYSRYELYLRFGENKLLLHATHHLGTTGSASYEGTAPAKELVEAYTEAGRWKQNPPDAIVRSHRHRHYKVEISSANVNAISVVTPSWQLKTPFSYKGVMGRLSSPQIGGIVIREGDDVPVYERHCVWSIPRTKEEII